MSEICPHCGGTGRVPEPSKHTFHGLTTIPIDPPVTLEAGMAVSDD